MLILSSSDTKRSSATQFFETSESDKNKVKTSDTNKVLTSDRSSNSDTRVRRTLVLIEIYNVCFTYHELIESINNAQLQTVTITITITAISFYINRTNETHKVTHYQRSK